MEQEEGGQRQVAGALSRGGRSGLLTTNREGCTCGGGGIAASKGLWTCHFKLGRNGPRALAVPGSTKPLAGLTHHPAHHPWNVRGLPKLVQHVVHGHGWLIRPCRGCLCDCQGL